jgi:integrase
MRPIKTRKPFTLYKKETKTGLVWYARFWDENSRRYAVTRSTGIPVEGKRFRRYDAEQAAREMLPGIQFTPAAAEKSFIQYVADFWLPDSPYVRECTLIKKKPLAAAYINLHHEDVRRHIEPFPGFHGIGLRQLTPGHIRDWMRWMAEKGMKGGRINKVMQAMSVAVRYAVAREELDRDPFKNIHEAPDVRKEKGVLSLAELAKLISMPATDTRGRLAVLLGALCGLRLGEVRGLLWGDIGEDTITVCHNYQKEDGLKAPKWNSSGILPITATVRSAIDAVFKLAVNPRLDAFVMESIECPGQPYCKTYFSKALERELEAIGIPGKWKGKSDPPEEYVDEQRRRNLTFHSLRHTFITLGRLAGISDLEIQALARHKSGAMMERYSHAAQVLDFSSAKEKLEKAVSDKGA